MKKSKIELLLSLLIIIVLMSVSTFMLTSCNSDSDTGTTTAEPIEETETGTSETSQENETEEEIPTTEKEAPAPFDERVIIGTWEGTDVNGNPIYYYIKEGGVLNASYQGEDYDYEWRLNDSGISPEYFNINLNENTITFDYKGERGFWEYDAEEDVLINIGENGRTDIILKRVD